MPRRARLILPNVPMHLIQRGHDRHACFFADDDYHCYLHWLERHASRCDCTVHAYVLMTNHVHLVLSAQRQGGPAAMMKALNERYVRYVNSTYRRTGTLWEGRFRSCLAQEEDYLLTCQRYVELNPVRACMVSHPAEYRWSSYRANAQGDASTIVQAHSLYQALGTDAAQRQAAYRELFRCELDPGLVDQIRRATNGNYALGNAHFVAQVSAALGRRATPGVSGRPRQVAPPITGELF